MVPIVLLAVFLFTACGGSSIDANTPPEIVYGEDVCDQCGMIISDERYAAGLVVETAPNEYEHRIFDDIGGMFAYATEHQDELKVVSYFVHDYNSKEWIDARTAYFVRSDRVTTPMGYGLAACKQRATAQALAQESHGTVLTFDEARAQVAAMPGMEHMHSQ